MNVKVTILFSIMLLIPSMSTAGDSPWDMKLPFKEAVVTYELSGMESGQEKLYIKDYGKRTARHRTTSTTVLGMTQEARTVEIVSPEWIYTFDLRQRAGTRSVNPQKLMIEEYRGLSPEERKKVDENAGQMAGILTDGVRGNVEPHARSILGFSCDRITTMGTTVYAIHNSSVSLLSESNIMGVRIKSTAVAIDTQEADDAAFAFPDGIVPQPSTEKDLTAAMIARQTLAVLKDPELLKPGSPGIIGVPLTEDQDIPEEDRLQMQEAMKTIKELFGN